jgi:hypothetical protein
MDTDEALAKISGHLMKANDLIGADEGSELGGHISWAQMVMEERLGEQALGPVTSFDEAARGTRLSIWLGPRSWPKNTSASAKETSG